MCVLDSHMMGWLIQSLTQAVLQCVGMYLVLSLKDHLPILCGLFYIVEKNYKGKRGGCQGEQVHGIRDPSSGASPQREKGKTNSLLLGSADTAESLPATVHQNGWV